MLCPASSLELQGWCGCGDAHPMLLQPRTFPVPSWSLIAVTSVRALFERPLGKPQHWGCCYILLLCCHRCPGLQSWGLQSESFSPPTNKWDSPASAKRCCVGGVGVWGWGAQGRPSPWPLTSLEPRTVKTGPVLEGWPGPPAQPL